MPHVDELGHTAGLLAEHDVMGRDVVVQQHARFHVVHIVQRTQYLGKDGTSLVGSDFPFALDFLGKQLAAEVNGNHVVAHPLLDHEPATVDKRNDVSVRQLLAIGNLFHLAMVVQQPLGCVLDAVQFQKIRRVVLVGYAIRLTVGIGLDHIHHLVVLNLLAFFQNTHCYVVFFTNLRN